MGVAGKTRRKRRKEKRTNKRLKQRRRTKWQTKRQTKMMLVEKWRKLLGKICWFRYFCAQNVRHIWAASWQNQQSECAPSKDSSQPGHPPSLIRVFAVRMKKPWILSYPLSAQRRLWSDWADAQADLSLRWVHMSVCWFCHKAAHTWKVWEIPGWTTSGKFCCIVGKLINLNIAMLLWFLGISELKGTWSPEIIKMVVF